MKQREVKLLEKIALERGGHILKVKKQLDQIIKETTAVTGMVGLKVGRNVVVRDDKVIRIAVPSGKRRTR